MTAITTPPVQLTAGVTVQLVQPQTYVLGAVVVSNLSPLLLTVAIGTRSVYQQPFTENLYELAGSLSAPVSVSPALPVGASAPSTGAAQVTATWYETGQVPAGSWPVSLTANAITAALAAGSQVVAVDNPTLLYQSPIHATSGTSERTVIFPCATFASIMVTYFAWKAVAGTGVPTPRTVLVEWFAGTFILATEKVVFMDTDVNSNDSLRSRLWLPAKGDGVRFTFGTYTGQLTFTYAIVGTYRTPTIDDAYFSGGAYWVNNALGNNNGSDGIDGLSSVNVADLPVNSQLVGYPNTTGKSWQLSATNFGGLPLNISVETVDGTRIYATTMAAGTTAFVTSGRFPRRPIRIVVNNPSTTTAVPAGSLLITLVQ